MTDPVAKRVETDPGPVHRAPRPRPPYALLVLSYAVAAVAAFVIGGVGAEYRWAAPLCVGTLYAGVVTLVAHALLTGPREDVDPPGETPEGFRERIRAFWFFTTANLAIVLVVGMFAPKIIVFGAVYAGMFPSLRLIERSVTLLATQRRRRPPPGDVGVPARS